MKCLDTHALVEIHNGNPKFATLLSDEIVIPNITFSEFYWYLLRKYDKRTADYWHRRLAFFCQPVSIDTLLKAMVFRLEHSREDLSFFDCVGYTFARELNAKFVTGDGAFKEKEGVEFIK